MLNSKTIETLGELSSLSDKLVMRYPVTHFTNGESKTFYVKVDWTEIDLDKFEDFGIYNLSEFIGTFKLFKDRKVVQTNNILTISNSETTVTTITDNLQLCENASTFDLSQMDKALEVASVVEFKMTKEDMKNFKNAYGVFKSKNLEEIIFKYKDSKFLIELGNENAYNAKTASYSKRINEISTMDFNFKISAENFSALPLNDYDVLVKYNDKNKRFRIIFKAPFYTIMLANKTK